MPNSNPPVVRAAILMPLVLHFEERGGDVDLLLEDMQISKTILTNPDQLIAVKAAYDTTTEIANRLGDPFVGATVGRKMARDRTGVLSAHLSEEQSVGSFLDRFLVSVGKFGNSTGYRVENDGQNATLKMMRKARPDASAAQPDAITLAYLVEQIRPRVGSGWNDRDVLAVVVDETVIPEWLLPRSSLITGAEMGLTLRMPAHWMVLSQEAQNNAAPLSEIHRLEKSLNETVKDFCRENLSDPKLDIAITARACRLHPKALSRKLSEEGTSFKAILDEQRWQFATSAVAEGKMPVTEVALRTGFTQASNFSRAFRRWTGETPSDVRARSK